MNSYVRDDGTVMVETKPGCFTRRDSLGSLGLSPLSKARAAAPPATAVEPPPLVPTLEDLAPAPIELSSKVMDGATAGRWRKAMVGRTDRALAAIGEVLGLPSGPVLVEAPNLSAPPHAPRPKAAKRSIAAILAEADRNSRARRTKARP